MTARPDRPGHEELRRLLSERNQYPERAAQIDERIRAAFERRVAILVLDMCGFSRLSRKHGIIFYLAMIRQMEEAATPAVVGNGGRVIKQEADNLFAVFDQPGAGPGGGAGHPPGLRGRQQRRARRPRHPRQHRHRLRRDPDHRRRGPLRRSR